MKFYPINRNTSKEINFWDDPIDHFFRPLFYDEKLDAMRTDIKETKDNYVLEIEMPGFDKADITIDYEDEYVTVSASKKEETGEEPKENEAKKSYIRKERSVSCQRSYYVGDIDSSLITAKLDKGILELSIPKALREKPQKKGIVIE